MSTYLPNQYLQCNVQNNLSSYNKVSIIIMTGYLDRMLNCSAYVCDTMLKIFVREFSVLLICLKSPETTMTKNFSGQSISLSLQQPHLGGWGLGNSCKLNDKNYTQRVLQLSVLVTNYLVVLYYKANHTTLKYYKMQYFFVVVFFACYIYFFVLENLFNLMT